MFVLLSVSVLASEHWQRAEQGKRAEQWHWTGLTHCQPLPLPLPLPMRQAERCFLNVFAIRKGNNTAAVTAADAAAAFSESNRRFEQFLRICAKR